MEVLERDRQLPFRLPSPQGETTYNLQSEAGIVLVVKLMGMRTRQLESIITFHGANIFFIIWNSLRASCTLYLSLVRLRGLLNVDGRHSER